MNQFPAPSILSCAHCGDITVHSVPQQLSAVQTGLKAAESVQIFISLSHHIYTLFCISLPTHVLVCICSLPIALPKCVCAHESKLSCLTFLVFLTFLECQSVCVCVLSVFVEFKCQYCSFSVVVLLFYILFMFCCIFDVCTHSLYSLSSCSPSFSLQEQTVSIRIWSWRSWWTSAQEESRPLHPHPPRPPHPRPLPPPPPHSAPQKDTRYAHTHLKTSTGRLYFLSFFSPPLFPFISLSLSFFLSTPSKGHPINQVRLTPVVSRLTLCTHQSVGPLHVRP